MGEHCKKLLGKLFKDKDSPVLIVYSMYSLGRTAPVAKALIVMALESGVKLDAFLLDGGLHKFVNVVCRGKAHVSDMPGLLEDTNPKNWQMTPNEGFVNALEVQALDSLR